LSKQCKYKLKQYHKLVDRKILESVDPNRFHKYVKYKLHIRSSVGSLLDKDDYIMFDTQVKVELVNDYFVSTFTVDNNLLQLQTKRVPLGVSMCEADFSVTNILGLLIKQPSKISAGPDGIPQIFYKKTYTLLG